MAFYNELIRLIKNNYDSEYKIITAPGPNETNDAKNIHAKIILCEEKTNNNNYSYYSSLLWQMILGPHI